MAGRYLSTSTSAAPTITTIIPLTTFLLSTLRAAASKPNRAFHASSSSSVCALRSRNRSHRQPISLSLSPRPRLSCDPLASPFSPSNSFCRSPSSVSGFCTMASVDSVAVEENASALNNPLLEDSAFPRFDAVEAKHVVSGIRTILKQLEQDLVRLEENVKPTWSDLVEPLESVGDRLSVAWGTVNHLKAVKDSSELRAAVEAVQPEKVNFQLKLGQSRPIYEAFKAICEGSLWGTLTEAQQRIVEGELKEAMLNGVGLDGEAKIRFNEIRQEHLWISKFYPLDWELMTLVGMQLYLVDTMYMMELMVIWSCG